MSILHVELITNAISLTLEMWRDVLNSGGTPVILIKSPQKKLCINHSVYSLLKISTLMAVSYLSESPSTMRKILLPF